MSKILLILSLVLFQACNLSNLVSGDQNTVSDRFYGENSNNNGGGGGGSQETLTLSFTFPTQKRTYYVNDDTGIRKVNFSHNSGGTTDCSLDGGTTWSSCTSPYTWPIGMYNSAVKVRLNYDNRELIQEFTPSSKLPGITFVNCSWEVTSSESFTAFKARSFASGTVGCLANGVTITNSGAEGNIPLSSGNVTIIAREGSTATFTSGQSAASEIFNVTGDNTRFVGLTLTLTGATMKALRFLGSSLNLLVEDSTINMTLGNNWGIDSGPSGGTVNNITARYLTINNTNTVGGGGTYLANSNLTLHNCDITAGFQAIYLWNHSSNSTSDLTITINNSTIKGTKTNPANATEPGVFNTLSANATYKNVLTISGSTVISSGGPAFVFDDSANINTLTLTNTTVKRDSVANFDGPAISSKETTLTNLVSVDVDTRFCNMSSNTSEKFTSILADASSSPISFDPTVMTAHSSNTDIGLCP